MGASQRLGTQQVDLPAGHRLGVPFGFRLEELQLLDGCRLRLRDGLGPYQGGPCLVVVTRQQQPREVLAETAALDVRMEQLVKGVRILVEGERDGRGVLRARWGHWQPPCVVCVLSHHPHPTTYSNKVPMKGGAALPPHA
jgi:hypothetical protein